MKNIMKQQVNSYLKDLTLPGDIAPLWALVFLVVLVLLCVVLAVVISRRRLIKTALRVFDSKEKESALAARLAARPRVLNILLKKKGDDVITRFELQEYLLERFRRKKHPDDAKRVLTLAADAGAFSVLEAALEKKSAAEVFTLWLQEKPSYPHILSLGLSSDWKTMNIPAVRRLLLPVLDQIPEFAGHPDACVRFFALRLLLQESDPVALRAVKEAFADSNELIRRTVAEKGLSSTPDELFPLLFSLVLNDPSSDVRESARRRIENQFPRKWKLQPEKLSAPQALHVLQQLKTNSAEDENTALVMLQSRQPECRLGAARFLEKSGVLNRLFAGASRGDIEDWERRKKLLCCAMSVGVYSFLEQIKQISKTGILLLAADLLSSEYGESADRSLVTVLADQIFFKRHLLNNSDWEELYYRTVTLVCRQGNAKARQLLFRELQSRRRDKALLDYILPLLPPDEASVFRPVLLDFLTDPDFPSPRAFVSLMEKLPPSMFMNPVMEILESDSSASALPVRILALSTLGIWKQDCTLQTVIENLPLLPRRDRRNLTGYLESVDTQMLEERVVFVLDSPDAGIREALISALPLHFIVKFRRKIQKCLKDAHPQVRISALQALLEDSSDSSSGQIPALLNDPVLTVRREACFLTALKPALPYHEELIRILQNTEEDDSVRQSVLEGLRASLRPEALHLLVKALSAESDIYPQVVKSLASKKEKTDLEAMMEHFKTADEPLKTALVEVFVLMGEPCEKMIIQLLFEKNADNHPFLTELLTRTGCIESLSRTLSHSQLSVRKKTIQILELVGTPAALRGMASAHKDPSPEIRKKAQAAAASLEVHS